MGPIINEKQLQRVKDLNRFVKRSTAFKQLPVYSRLHWRVEPLDEQKSLIIADVQAIQVLLPASL